MKFLGQRFGEFMRRNERHISSLALLFGFIFDSLTLRRADLLLENLFLSLYVVLVAVCIVRLNTKPRPWNLIVMQFCLGNLFSAFLIFYSRSASLVASWPFLLILLGLMIVNERLRERYARLTFQIAVFFFVLFSYAIFLFPIIVRDIGPIIFISGGLTSLFLVSIFIQIIKKVASRAWQNSRSEIITSISAIFVLLNVLYFTNIIPPIPLSLKEIGIYRSIIRNADGSYNLVKGELAVGAPLYAYSAVFAPTELDVKVVHVWEYFDQTRARWVVTSRVPFLIQGGRDGGFRGYSVKSNLFAGLWRVSVETEDGKLIGRKKFNVKN